MKEKQHFFVNGRDYGIASLDEYRKDISVFSDVVAYSCRMA